MKWITIIVILLIGYILGVKFPSWGAQIGIS